MRQLQFSSCSWSCRTPSETARGAESSSCASVRGGGDFLKIVTLEEVLKIVIVGKFWGKSIRRSNLVLFMINYRISFILLSFLLHLYILFLILLTTYTFGSLVFSYMLCWFSPFLLYTSIYIHTYTYNH